MHHVDICVLVVMQVKGRLAQVKGRKMDVLLQWWMHHGRSKCFKSE